MILANIWPYTTFVIGFSIGLITTKTKLKNTLLSIEITHREAETQKIIAEAATIIAKTEEGGSVKIRSKIEQAIIADEERNRVQELVGS